MVRHGPAPAQDLDPVQAGDDLDAAADHGQALPERSAIWTSPAGLVHADRVGPAVVCGQTWWSSRHPLRVRHPGAARGNTGATNSCMVHDYW